MPAGQFRRQPDDPSRTGRRSAAAGRPIQVRVPADSPPGDDIKYIITVQNISSADAHGVTVRNPLPEDVEKVVKAEPERGQGIPTDKQLVWSLGTLKPGKTKTIELTLRHKPDVNELKNLAYVKFEHGQAVTTKIAKPTIKVTKAAPEADGSRRAVHRAGAVENTGQVPAENVRVVENLPTSAEFEAITAGGRRVPQHRRTAVAVGDRASSSRASAR